MVGGLTLGAYLLGLFHLGAPGMEGRRPTPWPSPP